MGMTVKLDSPAFAAILGAPDGAVVDVTLSGLLLDGSGFAGNDQVRVIHKR
jgi:hypothetical protein